MTKDGISKVISGAIFDILVAVRRTEKSLSKDEYDAVQATLTAVIINMTDDEALRSSNILTTKFMMAQFFK